MRWVCSGGGYVHEVGMSRGWVCPWGGYVQNGLLMSRGGHNKQAGGTHPTGMLSCLT